MTRRASRARLRGANTLQISTLRSSVIQTARQRVNARLARGATDARAVGRDIGCFASTNLDELWLDASGATTGPIDVIDLFSGCGGMSAGFAAVNAVTPAFRLVAAVDVDEVAN